MPARDSIGNIGDALFRFAFEQKTIADIKDLGYDKAGLVFILASSIIGIIIIILDFGILKSKMRQKSLFTLSYPDVKTFLMTLLQHTYPSNHFLSS